VEDLVLDARSAGEFSNAVSSFLKLSDSWVVKLKVTIQKGVLKSFSTFTGDQGLKVRSSMQRALLKR
jgi:hypothetical protein